MSAASARQFANYLEDQPQSERLPVTPYQEWTQPSVSSKKPPQVAGYVHTTWEVARPLVPEDRALQGLDETYVIENRALVSRFIEEYRLHGLLLQAKEHLTARFGRDSIKTLSVLCDDEGFETLFCIINTSGDFEETRTLLRIFDQDWWLERARDTGGRLNFDVELV